MTDYENRLRDMIEQLIGVLSKFGEESLSQFEHDTLREAEGLLNEVPDRNTDDLYMHKDGAWKNYDGIETR